MLERNEIKKARAFIESIQERPRACLRRGRHKTNSIDKPDVPLHVLEVDVNKLWVATSTARGHIKELFAYKLEQQRRGRRDLADLYAQCEAISDEYYNFRGETLSRRDEREHEAAPASTPHFATPAVAGAAAAVAAAAAAAPQPLSQPLLLDPHVELSEVVEVAMEAALKATMAGVAQLVPAILQGVTDGLRSSLSQIQDVRRQKPQQVTPPLVQPKDDELPQPAPTGGGVPQQPAPFGSTELQQPEPTGCSFGTPTALAASFEVNRAMIHVSDANPRPCPCVLLSVNVC
jgi:hypothetical protein